MKVCYSCNQEFIPSSKHKNCPRCRYIQSKVIVCKICNLNKHSARYGNCRQCTNKTRTDYGTGKYKKNGYVMLFQKGHPRAQGSRGNYVFEHILVMESHLGRYLLPNENIHHINGVKDDNRLSNLELWIKGQPSGIRAKDALKWAREIIKAYTPLEKKL